MKIRWTICAFFAYSRRTGAIDCCSLQPGGSRGAAQSAVSSTVGRYLEAIFYIQGEREVARASRIADWVGVSQPTVAAAIGRMVRDGMIKVGTERELEFTKKGRELASSIVRRHRIAERWLVNVLKFDWLQADLEAGQLEHGMSMAVADRLHDLMGKPTTCPHGNPIPELSRGESLRPRWPDRDARVEPGRGYGHDPRERSSRLDVDGGGREDLGGPVTDERTSEAPAAT